MTDLYSNPDLVRSLFFYRDGSMYWKKRASSRINIGDKAGCPDSNGRLRLKYDGKQYSVHRLIYLMHHNTLPAVLDHIDGNYLNNCIENLREATQMQNMWNQKISKNNKSGVKGISWQKNVKKWYAQCMTNGVRKTIGLFADLEDAKLALEKHRAELHGEFARNA